MASTEGARVLQVSAFEVERDTQQDDEDSRTLRSVSRSIDTREMGGPAVGGAIRACAAALEEFRAKEGYGRAISAVQVGFAMRLVYLNLGDSYSSAYGEQFSRPFAMLNPELENLSEEKFRMWDDCLSLPNAMVLVERHRSCDVSFLDVNGRRHRWERLPIELAELLQHEVRPSNAPPRYTRTLSHRAFRRVF